MWMHLGLWPECDPPLVILAPAGSMDWWREVSAEVLRVRRG